MPGEDLRILIVDDNVDYATAMCALIRGWGYTAEVVHSGAQALASVETYRPRVVLLDLGLPDMPGYDLARRIRELSNNRRIFFVCVTGWSQIADQLKSTAAGISHHLIKPVNHDTLRGLLARYHAMEPTPETAGPS